VPVERFKEILLSSVLRRTGSVEPPMARPVEA
jgi:hypothetical protein